MIGAVFLAAGIATVAAAQTPAFDPREWHGRQAGAPTQVLTLGTYHLGQSSGAGAPSMSQLLSKLEAYRPEIITVENVSGEQCDHLKRYASVYPGSYDAWCAAPDLAQKALGVDGPTAAGELDKTLTNWPSHPTPSARRHLAALFLAVGDASAWVQWLKLPLEERHAGDGVTEGMLPRLNRSGAKPNETYDIAVALAVRLGVERIYLVDDHTSDGAVPDEGKPYADAIEAAWKVAPSKTLAVEKRMEANLGTSGEVLDYYRFLNRPSTLKQNIRADFGEALREPSSGQYGRQYVAGWEVRNLRMVSNVVATFASRPGARVLNIVGASHKPYYDAYLGMMHDVLLVDAEQVLN